MPWGKNVGNHEGVHQGCLDRWLVLQLVPDLFGSTIEQLASRQDGGIIRARRTVQTETRESYAAARKGC
jgi:hypothetical protein